MILDGAMGTMIQRYGLTEADYRSGCLSDCTKELKGNSECLNLTRPEIIKAIHREYIEAGADIIETNTFSANRISQAEYGCEGFAAQMAYEGARIAREVADEAMARMAAARLEGQAAETVVQTGVRKIWVAGSMGPTSKSLSLSPELSDPAFRAYSFDQMKESYREQAEALLRGGVDLLLVETCFDALNVKAALAAITECQQTNAMAECQHTVAMTGCQESAANAECKQPTYREKLPPVIVSVSVGDRSGRTLTGQTLEAFYTSVKHYPLLAFGLNCSLGAAELTTLLEDVDKWCECAISCYPNAGLPNEMGGYDQTPEQMGLAVRAMAEKGLVNIVGGCCGTTPEHIAAISKAVADLAPRTLSRKTREILDDSSENAISSRKTGDFLDASIENDSSSMKTGDFLDRKLTVSGLEAVEVDVKRKNFTNVGERTNVAGSRKFARLIASGEYDEALRIAAKQIEDGASIIDINMDDAMLDSTREMERFVRYISNDPAVAKAALMIDSSHWETIVAGLKNAQGKSIVNSISLKEGPEAFIEKAKAIKELGAAMVVMAFDEVGQATTYDRKIEICERAYRLLTQEAGIAPEDIIFDVNILSIGTGIEEHAKYAVDFIEAVRWIKTHLPGALTSGGVSNLSFAFRGNNAVREAMHSAFLYHAIKAGMDMAIVNPSMLQVYDEIEPELLKCVEDVIFDTDPQATERLIAKAAEMMAAKEAQAAGTAGETNGAARQEKSLEERLKDAIVKGKTEELEKDILEAMEVYGEAVKVIEGPLMDGMEHVGKMFGEGKMFLPQVVKAAKVMRDAVEILSPYMGQSGSSYDDSNILCNTCLSSDPKEVEAIPQTDKRGKKDIVVIATVKGDVHDIGKNILGIVMTCNGFEVHDLGVMVDKETILEEAERLDADIIAVSGLITPSLYQMEEICRKMASRGMTTPLLIGGATTSALHTAVKLAPLYDHVFYGPDASASAVLAKRCMADRAKFEAEMHAEQQKIRDIYNGKAKAEASASSKEAGEGTLSKSDEAILSESNVRRPGETGNRSEKHENKNMKGFEADTYITDCPQDIPTQEIPAEEVLPYFDWKMFYAIWGVKYGSAVPEAAELMQLRRDAEEELRFGDYKIMLSAKFMQGYSENDNIYSEDGGICLPMMRQETFRMQSLCDFVISKESGRTSPFGVFGICVKKRSTAHEEGCSCPACNSRYEDMIGKTVRQTIAEAASKWLNTKLEKATMIKPVKVVKPAAGYSSCPDHTLKKDILGLLGECTDMYDPYKPAHSHEHSHSHGHGHEHGSHGHDCTCGCGGHYPQGNYSRPTLGIKLTDSYAMTPDASICGLIFMHPEAGYPEIRNISQSQYDDYKARRGMDEETARRFLSHLLK